MEHAKPVSVPLEVGRKRPSLIQMVLLTDLKAGFEKAVAAETMGH